MQNPGEECGSASKRANAGFWSALRALVFPAQWYESPRERTIEWSLRTVFVLVGTAEASWARQWSWWHVTLSVLSALTLTAISWKMGSFAFNKQEARVLVDNMRLPKKPWRKLLRNKLVDHRGLWRDRLWLFSWILRMVLGLIYAVLWRYGAQTQQIGYSQIAGPVQIANSFSTLFLWERIMRPRVSRNEDIELISEWVERRD